MGWVKQKQDALENFFFYQNMLGFVRYYIFLLFQEMCPFDKKKCAQNILYLILFSKQ